MDRRVLHASQQGNITVRFADLMNNFLIGLTFFFSKEKGRWFFPFFKKFSSGTNVLCHTLCIDRFGIGVAVSYFCRWLVSFFRHCCLLLHDSRTLDPGSGGRADFVRKGNWAATRGVP
ncbi:uncharacterized protein [Apostichopus japonicus]|uniref:uncharacterized protein n=1 Tax=Stichopus japonicus TaxID=307972 RepID=UPI003AB35DD2